MRRGAAQQQRVAGDGTSERIAVVTGTSEGELIEVEGGIAAGDRLVIRGGERLLPGQRVVFDVPDAAAEAVAVR